MKNKPVLILENKGVMDDKSGKKKMTSEH